VPGDLAPALAITYSSSDVDGRTTSANNQPSGVGDGFELATGFVERRYAACPDDMSGGNNSGKTGDLCWKTDNATISFGGSRNWRGCFMLAFLPLRPPIRMRVDLGVLPYSTSPTISISYRYHGLPV